MEHIQRRAKALAWWRGMEQAEKEELAKKHRPTWTFQMVSASSSIIERIFIQEEK